MKSSLLGIGGRLCKRFHKDTVDAKGFAKIQKMHPSSAEHPQERTPPTAEVTG